MIETVELDDPRAVLTQSQGPTNLLEIFSPERTPRLNEAIPSLYRKWLTNTNARCCESFHRHFPVGFSFDVYLRCNETDGRSICSLQILKLLKFRLQCSFQTFLFLSVVRLAGLIIYRLLCIVAVSLHQLCIGFMYITLYSKITSPITQLCYIDFFIQ